MKIKPMGKVWNASKKWSKYITSHVNMIETIVSFCDIDDKLYVQDYNKNEKIWTTPRKMGYEEIMK